MNLSFNTDEINKKKRFVKIPLVLIQKNLYLFHIVSHDRLT